MQNSTRIGQIAEWISAGQVVILLLASPLFLFPRPIFAPVFLLLPSLWLIRRKREGHFFPRTPVDWPILGLLAMALLGVWATPDFASSYRKIVGLIYGATLYYALVDWGRRRRNLPRLVLLVVILGGGAALLGLLGTQWGVKLPVMRDLRPHLPRVITGLPDAEEGFNPNQVTGALTLFLPLQVALLVGLASETHTPKTRRILLGLALAASLILTGLTVLLAQSRAAWAWLAFGLVGMGAIALKRLRPLFLILLLVGAAILLLAGPVGVGEWLVTQGLMTQSGETSLEGRLELWSRGLWAVADFPLTGTGMNLFRRLVWRLYPLFHFATGRDMGHAHNAFIQAALDLGLPGLISYLALLGGTLAAGWRAYRRSQDRFTRLAALGGAVGLAVNALWGLTDAIALGAKHGFLWWAVLAVVVTAFLHGAQEEAAP
jgi:putative inorganic carbon (HCO3(-)) transporter